MLLSKQIKVAITCCCLFLSITGKTQEIDTVKFTGEFTGQQLKIVIDEISSYSKINIYYQPQWLDGIQYTGKFKNTSVTTVINKVLEKTPLVPVQIEDDIFIVPREQVALILKKVSNLNGYNQEDVERHYRVIGDIKESGRHKDVRVTGTVIDGATSEPIVGARIIVEGTKFYAISGYTGDYVLTIPAGIYRLKVNSMGYEEKIVDIKAYAPGVLNLEMFDESHAISEILITGEKSNKNVSRDQMSVLEMSAKSIKQLPSLIGERDIIKSFTTMPGVKSVGEFGSGINVRGGGEDQNLYLFENAPIFNTSHVMGLLSVVNPDAVNKVNLYKGHIPIQYGERVSSVMEINIHNPNIDKFKVRGGLGIYSSRLLVETPLLNNKITLKLGARSSYSDYLLSLMPDYNLKNSSASFYDLTGSIGINLKNNPVTFFGYYSTDKFKYNNNFEYNYGNKLLSGSWTHIFSPNLTFGLTGSYSNYALSNYNWQIFNQNKLIESRVSYTSAKIGFEYLGLLNQDIDFGLQIINYSLKPGSQQPIDKSTAKTINLDPETGYEMSAYIGDGVTINNKISFQAGLRYTLYSYLGPRKMYTYQNGLPATVNTITDSTIFAKGQKIAGYTGIEPRASVKYQFADNGSLKFSYNRNQQYINLLSYTSITTPEDRWKLADKYIKPVISDQAALGIYMNFFNNLLETSAEVYYKKLANLTEYRNNAQLSLNNHVETELISARGKNYGIELMIKKTDGKFNGNISYTYSRAFKKTEGTNNNSTINNNNWYASTYDVPNALNLNLNYNLNRRIRFGANFSYSTGRPVTLPEYTYMLGKEVIVYYSDRNKYRLPDYHRLDLSLSIDESLKKTRKWKGSWTFAILNIYARKNAYSIIYSREEPTIENNYQAFSLSKMYLIGMPMPTVTYNFIF